MSMVLQTEASERAAGRWVDVIVLCESKRGTLELL